MDEDNVFAYFFLIAVCCGGIVVVGFLIHGIFVSPRIQANAQETCEQSGFETYINYRQLPFRTQPLALYCGTYEQRMIKEKNIIAYTTDEGGSIVISDINRGG